MYAIKATSGSTEAARNAHPALCSTGRSAIGDKTNDVGDHILTSMVCHACVSLDTGHWLTAASPAHPPTSGAEFAASRN